MVRKTIIGTSFTVLFLLSPTLSFAQSPSPTRPNKEAKIEERCQTATTRIETILARYKNNREYHINRYKLMVERLKNLGDRLEAKGYDISQVETDLKTLNEKITKFGQDANKFIDQLNYTQGFDCGNSAGAFVNALREAQQALRTVREDALDIRHYYQTVVRPHVTELKNQKPNTSPSPNL